jgi:hypothetical protein
MERRKTRDYYEFRCAAKRIAPDSCDGNYIREDAVNSELSGQLIQFKDELLKQLNVPSKDKEILPELRFIEMELSRLQKLTRSLYENLVTGVIDDNDFLELKEGYQVKIDEYKQREAILQKILDDEKSSIKHKQESLRILDVFTDTLTLTSEHINRFIDKTIIYKDGRVHIEVLM